MDCYYIPTEPNPLLLPVECVAEVVPEPELEAFEDARANWMLGHVTWNNQRIPAMAYSGLHDASIKTKEADLGQLVVLNPVPDAARKAYSGLVCGGDVKTVSVDGSAEFVDLPEGVDGRYAEAAIQFNDVVFLVPRLSALAVAFSYF